MSDAEPAKKLGPVARRLAAARALATGEAAAIEGISADLPFELQSKMCEQLATLGVAGSGLVITLAGSILKEEPLIWLSVVYFGSAAITAIGAQQQLIDSLFRKSANRFARIGAMLSTALIGMGVGNLAMSVALAKGG